MQYNTLILDDEKLVCNSIKRILDDKENIVHTAVRVNDARKILQETEIDLVLLDYKLNEIDGISILKEIKHDYPHTCVIMLTAFATIDLAVRAMKLGAFDFIQKEESPDIIRYAVQRALDHLRLRKEVEDLRLKCKEDTTVPDIISVSSEMQDVLQLAKEFAQTDATVLITGETGTGKNLLAKHIHFNSLRFNEPLITLNCAAIPSELIESELFGYERGSFTGARKEGKKGLIEQANNGTLMLDEIGELNFDLQTKLLHILENNEFYRIGGVKPVKLNVRFIACSNANLPALIKTNKFRSDLYYRLNVANIHIPALRDRKMDILPLAKFFLDYYNQTFKKSVTRFGKGVESFFLTSFWPGNVRELRNNIERAVLLAKNDRLELKKMLNAEQQEIMMSGEQTGSTFSIQLSPQPNLNLLHEVQDQLVRQALDLTKQNRSQAAKMLGIPRTSLNHYLKRLQKDHISE